MSSIRIESKELVGMLTDLARTSSRYGLPSDGVLLHSARGPIGDEPGEQSLLVGTSVTSGSVGYAIAPAAGSLPDPMLWPISDVDAVLAMLAKIIRGRKGHAVEITRRGDEITVAEDPDLLSDGTALRFTASPLTGYPGNAWRLLDLVDPDPPGAEPAGVRTDYAPGQLAPFVQIAARRRDSLQLYRYHQRRVVLIQIGACYRGLIGPASWDTDLDGVDGGRGPDVEIYIPDLPAPDDESIPDRLLVDAASLVITMQRAGVSLLQRRLRVGEARAGLLLRQLEARGVVAAAVGSSAARDVLVPRGERQQVLDRLAAEVDDQGDEQLLFVDDQQGGTDG